MKKKPLAILATLALATVAVPTIAFANSVVEVVPASPVVSQQAAAPCSSVDASGNRACGSVGQGAGCGTGAACGAASASAGSGCGCGARA